MDYYIKQLNKDTINTSRLFCLKSKSNSKGYKEKLRWINLRLTEGMGYYQVYVKQKNNKYQSKGFIEFIPGTSTWRNVNAPDSMVIHCLWVVGKARKQGFGKKLLKICEEQAIEAELNGIAVLTSDRPFLTNGKFFKENSYSLIEKKPPYYSLYFKQIRDSGEIPFIVKDVIPTYHEDIVIFDTPQCPYTKAMVDQTLRIAEANGLTTKLININSREDVRLNPVPYGTFGILFKNQHLTYYSMNEKRFITLLDTMK